jgi:hypothetical protein
MDTRTPRADEGAFQVQAEDAVLASDRASRHDCGPHLLASVGDQGWEARRGAIATVRPRNGAHAVGRWLIVEKDAAAPITLHIYEAWGYEGANSESCLRPIGGYLIPWPKPNDAPVPNQHRRFGMPSVTVKNTVRQDGMPIDN